MGLRASTGIAIASIACGPVINAPEGETDDPTGETDQPTDPSDPSDSSDPTIDPTQGDCVSDDDCSYGYSCINNFCQYDCYCGCGVQPPPGTELRCSDVGPWYECYSDADCGEAEICMYGYCQPEPEACGSLPISATFSSLAFTQTDAPVVQMQFADVLPDQGAELYVARGNAIEAALADGTVIAVATTAAEILTFAIGDVDGDGIADLVTAEDGDDAPLRLWQGSEFGFVETEIVQTAASVRALAIVDRDGDGTNDVYAHVDRDVVVFPTSGGVPLGERVLLLEERVDAMHVFDDGDGYAQVLFADAGFSLFVEPGDPQVTELFITGSESLGPIVGGDFDGNGAHDAAAFTGYDQVTFTGPITSSDPLTESAGPPIGAAVGDIDGDGRSDLAILEPDNGVVRVRYGATTEPPAVPLHCDTPYVIDAILSRVAAGDFDADGRAELAVADGNAVLLVSF